jgi:ATP-dependent DNA helicase RecG
MAVTLNSDISELAGVGDAYAKKLNKLGISTIRDLLFYFPRRFDDFSKITPISNVKVGETISVRGSILDISSKRSRKGSFVTEAIISDDTGTCKAVWFRQPWLENSLKKGDEIFLAGKFEFAYGQTAFASPAYEKVHDDTGIEDLRHVGRIVPVYPETEGITSKWLRTKIASLAKLVYGIKDHLPEGVKKKHDLMELSAAVRTMHYPENFEELKKAKERMLIDNLFCLFCSVLSLKRKETDDKAIAVDYDDKVGKKFVSSLSFSLTDSQRKASWAILQDLGKTVPMSRLLEGDVGSGKTVVAVMAALMVAGRGYQTAILAPTEILARQHYESVRKLVKNFNVKVALLCGSTKATEKKEIIKGIADGDIQIIIGTHALFSPEVKFWTLAEQHRFGVEQRKALKLANGETHTMPHFLSMSATPIPRTLALTVFGDLAISVLTEMPPGRKKVRTSLVPPEKRNAGYKYIDEKIKEGRQVFVICPLVSPSDKLGVASAEEEAEKLSNSVFRHRRVGLLHGRMKPAEKERAMSDFKDGKIDILVSTSVVEVGVDVPNATIMIIEGAERFGLATLHQFRGRVGRGEHQSYCFLFTDTWSDLIEARLNALISSDNGFELADKDLEIRGPGELLGQKQSGKIDETLLAVMKDPKIIGEVRETAEAFLAKQGLKESPLLEEKVAEFNTLATLE